MNQTKKTTTSLKVAFVEARWHADIVGQCRKGFVGEFMRQGYDASHIEFFDVPGSLEIPLFTKKLAESGKFDAIVVTGLVVDGGIYRHDFVARAVLDGIMRVQLDTGMPVLSAILTPHQFQEHEQHKKFFYDHFLLKGKEAADACIEIIKAHSALLQFDAVAA